MKMILIPFAAVLVLSSGLSLAADQPGSSGPRAACRADVDKLCPGVQPGGGRIIACLQQNEAQVSAACKEALAKAREKKAPGAPGSPPA
jgi:hypothetical protein